MKILAFNWKLNPLTEREALSLSSLSDRKDVILFPPAVFLDAIVQRIKRAKVGVQNLFWEAEGAFTGELSPVMAKSLGVRWALVGHSERRRYFEETDEMVNKKIKAAFAAGLNVILCVGEPRSVRERGIRAARAFIRKQLVSDLSGIRSSEFKGRDLAIAYEPIWAVSGGAAHHPSDTPKDSAEMAKFIKQTLSPKPYPLNPKVLYGGSVNAKNIAAFLRPKEIDGVLIGGASLQKKELVKILSTKS